jgi:hypothetical protein
MHANSAEGTRILGLREELRGKLFKLYELLRDQTVRELIAVIGDSDRQATLGKNNVLSGGYVLNHLGCLLADIPRHPRVNDTTLTFAGVMSLLREIQDSAFTHGGNIDRVQLGYLIRRLANMQFSQLYGDHLGFACRESPEGAIEIIDNAKWRALHMAPMGVADGRWGEIYRTAHIFNVPPDIASWVTQVKFAGDISPVFGVGIYDNGKDDGWSYYHVYDRSVYINSMFKNAIWQYPLYNLPEDTRREDFEHFIIG